MFKPHTFENKVECYGGNPHVYFTEEGLSTMHHYVDIANQEISWMACVELIEGDFYVGEMFLLKQEVSAAETEISEDGLTGMAEEVLKRENGEETLNNIRGWFHSHVDMGTFASGQDKSQMDEFKDSVKDTDKPFFIRAILNKKGRMQITIFLYDKGLVILDAEWSVIYSEDNSLREKIKAEIAEKVKASTYQWQGRTNRGHGNFYDGLYGDYSSYHTPETRWEKKERQREEIYDYLFGFGSYFDLEEAAKSGEIKIKDVYDMVDTETQPFMDLGNWDEWERLRISEIKLTAQEEKKYIPEGLSFEVDNTRGNEGQIKDVEEVKV